MPCPKCGATHNAADAECRRCGVVFAKLARFGLPLVLAGVFCDRGDGFAAAVCTWLSRASRRDE